MISVNCAGCFEAGSNLEILTVKKHRMRLDDAKEIIDALEGIGYHFSHFEGSLMVFKRGGE
ncbi:hypothetical protein [Geoglobus acetivorans]|uniref:HMA domain-containing protein n=1 Tax=Geoglobus acetivorans TaxID=565033 RepID=A0ABZ3H1P9_GEOAI|nr:hypothetical protein [Geoglobus acetivorans]